jgi:hypothetical protein
MGMAVSSYRYRTRRCDEELRIRLVELAREKPRFGYRRLHVLLRRCGERVNHKRVHRVYREAGLMIRRKKRKHCVREGKPLLARTAANQEWALDFVHAGSRHQFCQPESDASVGTDRERARVAAGDPLRQWTRADESAFSGVVRGTTDRISAHSTGQAYAERSRRKLSRTAARRMLERELVSELVRCATQNRSVADRV